MAFSPRGNTIVFPAVAAFSGSGAKLVPPGFQIRVHNNSSSIAWLLIATTQAEANAAAIPTTGAPTPAVGLEPGEVEVFQHQLGNNPTGPWINVCTPTDTAGTSGVEVTSGSGE